jgi:hypothetical protein
MFPGRGQVYAAVDDTCLDHAVDRGGGNFVVYRRLLIGGAFRCAFWSGLSHRNTSTFGTQALPRQGPGRLSVLGDHVRVTTAMGWMISVETQRMDVLGDGH